MVHLGVRPPRKAPGGKGVVQSGLSWRGESERRLQRPKFLAALMDQRAKRHQTCALTKKKVVVVGVTRT